MLGEKMEIGESIKGKDLPMEEGSILSKGGKAHIVFYHRICRPSMIDGTESRGEKVWKKVEECTDYENYGKKSKKLGYRICKSCIKRLEKGGHVQV